VGSDKDVQDIHVLYLLFCYTDLFYFRKCSFYKKEQKIVKYMTFYNIIFLRVFAKQQQLQQRIKRLQKYVDFHF